LNTDAAITTLLEAVPEPSQGLPDNVFYYISRTTPLVNVDLLIQDETGRTLLAWRDDPHAGTGWHIPGGVVRFKELLETRIKKVAEMEIGTDVQFDPEPIAIHQIILPEREIRGHFISLLYKCYLTGTFNRYAKRLTEGDAGYLAWHSHCPNDLLPIQNFYRRFMEDSSRNTD